MRINIDRIALAIVLACVASPAFGVPCSNCHTMHNSQDRQPMRFDLNGSPLPMLLRGTCIQCHTGLNTVVSTTPGVYSTASPTYVWGDTSGAANTALAGGSFYYVDLDETAGHNVREIAAAGFDARLVDTPPGGSALPASGPSPQLKCAGTNGCHGDTAIANPLLSLSGAHHQNVTGASVDGTSIGRSYRFLDGVLGWEDTNWEFTSSTTDHNRYVAEDRALPTTVTASTISGFCAKCHGYFHNTTAGGGTPGIAYAGGFISPWLRHPTDFDMADLPGTSDYAAYNTYKTKAPVGRSVIQLSAGLTSDVGNDQGILTCLTCHRAHGSPYNASMRWNYRAWPGIDPVTGSVQSGCQVCHTSKN